MFTEAAFACALEFLRDLGEFVIQVASRGSFNLKYQCWNKRRATQQAHGFIPINVSFARPQMRVAVSLIIVNVCGADSALHLFKCEIDASIEVGVAYVETKPYIVEVRGFHQLYQSLGRREFVRNVLQQHANAQWLGERLQVLD